MSNGHVKLSSKAIWDKGEHPESLEQSPALELRVELTDYTSRQKMADMLRTLANWIDEGVLHPFDPPLVERQVEGVWDDENKQWIISENEA
jgi:hypothetical protein